MSPTPRPSSVPLLSCDELQERLAARSSANLAVLGRIARRVVEEEVGRREAGKLAAGPELLVERALRLVSAAIPPAPPVDEPFELDDEPPALALDDEPPFSAFEPPPPPPAEVAPEPSPGFTLEALPDQPSRRWVRVTLWAAAVAAALLAVAAGIAYLAGLSPGRSRGEGGPPAAVAESGLPAPRPAETATPVPEPSATAPPSPTPEPTAPAPPTFAPTPAPTAAPTTAPTPAPAATRELPVPAVARTAPAVAARVGAQGRAGLFATADWSGGAFFAIHFSSYRDRASAERDARALAARLGLPARVLTADLGAEGVWYRVMLGDFTDEGAALAARNDLAERHTPDLGYVFKVTARR